MKKFRTHYDNLKISRDAPDYIIRAAYKVMVQKYHPDKNPGDSRATKILSIINESYAVLSDPIKRKEHDEWILKTEAKINSSTNEANDTTDKYSPPNFNEPNNYSGNTRNKPTQSIKPISNQIKNIILIVISFLLFKYFGLILGLTVIVAYLTWTKIKSYGLLLQATSTISVLAIGILYWQSIALPHYELLSKLTKLQRSEVQKNAAQPSENIKIESSDKPVAKSISKPKEKPVWLKPSKDEDEHIQTSIGLFTKVIIDNWNMRMGIQLNGKPILDEIIEEDGGRAYLEAVVDYGDAVVIFFDTASGGNCGDCYHTYAVSMNSNGTFGPPINVSSELEWKYQNEAFYSEPIPVNGKLFTAVIKRSGVNLVPRELLDSDEAPKYLCSGLFYELSNSCPAISLTDCTKISNLNTSFTLLELNGRSPNNNGANMRFYRLLNVADKDPRFNFTDFKNTCRNYCEGNQNLISEKYFATKFCNSQQAN